MQQVTLSLSLPTFNDAVQNWYAQTGGEIHPASNAHFHTSLMQKMADIVGIKNEEFGMSVAGLVSEDSFDLQKEKVLEAIKNGCDIIVAVNCFFAAMDIPTDLPLQVVVEGLTGKRIDSKVHDDSISPLSKPEGYQEPHSKILAALEDYVKQKYTPKAVG